jgi:exosortase A
VPEAPVKPVTGQSSIQRSLLATGVFFLLLLLIFHETTWSMISIWLRSDTFAHGFLILPIALWLVWIQRDRLRVINSRPALWVVLLMIPPGFVWLLAWLVDVLVVQQLAMVSMLVVGAWAILGHQLSLALAFPLLFLFFAVPMGEALIAPMMEFTATSTVWLIRQTGIPVYREGLYFTLPSGSWSVVEACSGVRYIIASVTLGVLYAYLTYRSFWRRGLFVLVSVVVPVFANTMRAYIIVMLGHASGMKIATGVDHLIYGWVFFGLVMFLLFWLGSFFREDREALSADGFSRSMPPPGAAPASSGLLAATLASLLTAAVWPLMAYTTESRPGAGLHAAVILPEPGGAWRAAPEPGWQWQPDSAVMGQVASYYDLNGQTLGLYIQYPLGVPEEGEVVGSSVRFIKKGQGLRVIGRDRVTLQPGDGSILVDQARLVGVGGQLLAWSWYRIGDVYTSNDYHAKLREALASLGFSPSGSYRIVVVLPLQDPAASTRVLLQDFWDAHGKQLDKALYRAMEGAQQWPGTVPH